MDINPQSIVDSISAASNGNQRNFNTLIECLSFILDSLYKAGSISLKEKNAWKKKLVQANLVLRRLSDLPKDTMVDLES